jgi:heavy metal sensor kinase
LRTIRVRLTLWYLVILLAALSVFATVVYVVFARGLRAEMDRSLEAVALGAVDVVDGGRLELDTDAVPSEYAISLYLPDGEVLVAGHHQTLPRSSQGSAALDEARWRSVRLGADSWRVLVQPVVVDGQVVATLQVGRPEKPGEHAVEQLGLLLATLVPLAVLLAGTGGLFMARRALDPIDRITRTATSIGADDLARRLPSESLAIPDEVGRLATAFNYMLDRLDGAFQRQRQFTADASHELRTPLMLLLTQVDIALQRPRTADEHRQVLISLREDLMRFRRLLDTLLSLARADAREDILVCEPLELGELAEQVVDVMQPMADERDIRLAAHTECQVVVQGDQAHLMQLLVNLVENALKHTPAGGSVRVAVAGDTDFDTALIAVRDTGVGIASEHLPHLFERFYRVDPARSSSGAGLGLAICRWVAEAHGGRIDVESQPGTGTTFTVRLRRNPTSPTPPTNATSLTGPTGLTALRVR